MAPRGTEKGLALKVDGSGRQVYFDPYVGGVLAVAEAARNVACTGARPVAATDGLNFGNPQLPHVYWQFERAVKGIADAAEALGTPVISGNVSFYNESELGEVLPTPMIGVLGVLEHVAKRIGMAPRMGDRIGLLWIDQPVRQGGLGASQFLAAVHGMDDGVPSPTDPAAERRLCHLLADLVEAGAITAAHDISEGGLAVTLSEMAIASGFGLELDLGEAMEAFEGQSTRAATWFGETPGRVVVSFAAEHGAAIAARAADSGIRMAPLGQVGGDALVGVGDAAIPLGKLARAYSSLGDAFESGRRMTDKERILLIVPEELIGERVLVRACRQGDGPAIHAAIEESRDHLWPGMPWVEKMVDVEDCETYVRRRIADFILRLDLTYGIWEPTTGRYLGGTGLHRIDWDVRSFEIGYWIRKSDEGRGFVTDAVRLLTAMAFGQLEASRVFLRVTESNERSWRIPERLGFAHEGTIANEIRDAEGTLHPIRYYGMTVERWRTLR